MQLLMRRPEVTGFVAAAHPANDHDFGFLAPCPSSGMLINGTADKIVPPQEVEHLAEKIKLQKGITITHETVEGANHFFEPKMELMISKIDTYVRKRMTENSR